MPAITFRVLARSTDVETLDNVYTKVVQALNQGKVAYV